MPFKDHFSNHAKAYSEMRPTYPSALFQFLSSSVKTHKLAWDCATGNGQAALALTHYFDHVIASDASQQQISHAKQHSRIIYQVMPAEETNLAGQSIDLITVATALHWFDFAKFFAEVRRVLKPGGVIAAWCYSLPFIDNDECNQILHYFYGEIIGEFWPLERKYVDAHYHDIPFSFTEIQHPEFHIMVNWDLARFLAYVDTWSAVQRYIKQRKVDPVVEFLKPQMAKAWGDVVRARKLQFLLPMRVARV